MIRSLTNSVWLTGEVGGAPDREVLFGDDFEVTREADGMSFGVSLKDGYPGWVASSDLGPQITPTHWVAVRTTIGFAKPDIKSAPLRSLHMTSRVEILDVGEAWCKAEVEGAEFFVPKAHLKPMGAWFEEPVEAARLFLGTPYLWAGNSGFGIDCSGLVQAAYRACGWQCAADSGPQSEMPGQALTKDDALEPGDLIFWKGHVAMATGPDTMIHANAHHMKVVEEAIEPAIARINATDTGAVTSILRPSRQPV